MLKQLKPYSFLGLFLAAQACSVDDWRGGSKSQFGTGVKISGADSMVQDSDVVLEVTSAPANGAVSNGTKVNFETLVKVGRFSQATQKYIVDQLGVTVSVKGPNGMQYFSKSDGPKKTPWNIDLSKGDGVYTISIVPQVPEKLKLTSSSGKEFKITLDTTPPQIAIDANVQSDIQKGLRKVVVQVSTDDPLAACSNATITRSKSPGKSQDLGLKMDAVDGIKPTGQKFRSDVLVLTGELDDVFVSVECKDPAGNSSTAKKMAGAVAVGKLVPTVKSTLVEGLSATIGSGKITEILPGTKFLFARRDTDKPTKIAIVTGVIDSMLQQIVGSFADKAASAAKIYILFKPNDNFVQPTLQLPKVASDLSSPDITKYLQGPTPFGTSVDALVSATTIAEIPQHLYVIVSGFGADAEPASSVQVFPFSFIVTEKKPEIAWTTKTIIPDIEKGTLVPVGFQLIALGGAPLKPELTIEATNNDQTWTEVGVTDLKQSDTDFTAKIAYPGSGTRPVRLRVKGMDFSGNEIASQVSPGLTFGLNFARGESPACVGKAQIEMKPLWKFGCKMPTRDTLGRVTGLGTEVYIPVIARNIGDSGVQIEYYSNRIGYNLTEENGNSLLNYTKETVTTFPKLPDPFSELFKSNPSVSAGGLIGIGATQTHFFNMIVPESLVSRGNVFVQPNVEIYVKTDYVPKIPVESIETRPSFKNACKLPSDPVSLWGSQPLSVSIYPCDISAADGLIP